MKGIPTLKRSLLHPAANKAAAMDAAGHWLSYSGIPVIEDGKWAKPSPDTVCFRIPDFRAPEWTGKWEESLIVYEDEKL